jgi:CDP-diacylglycerol--glycerol-3-phosphate 3-phosphatidyltransferase
MTETARRSGNWNLPNALTALRLAMVPFFGWALLVVDGRSVLWRCVAFLIFVAAMVTDRIDGEIARNRDLVTNFGKIADPIADKALTGMAFVGLSLVDGIWWWVTAVVLAREWGITGLRLYLARRGHVVAASPGGKAKTLVQTVALGLLILPLRLVHGTLEQAGQAVWWVAIVLLGVAVALTVATGVDYVVKSLRA